tara:strand:- start:57 stop:515 length:459 start_codon:yes stop_codon:yes gene_type:complete
MFVIIDIYSKNYKSLKNFLSVFNDETIIKKLKISILKNKAKKPLKKKVITVLKSPHVNKTAQEKFEYRVYKERVKCFVPQILLLLIFIKKIKLNSFSDIKFKLNFISSFNIEEIKIKNNININNFSLVHKELNLIKYLKLLTISGEYLLKLK